MRATQLFLLGSLVAACSEGTQSSREAAAPFDPSPEEEQASSMDDLGVGEDMGATDDVGTPPTVADEPAASGAGSDVPVEVEMPVGTPSDPASVVPFPQDGAEVESPPEPVGSTSDGDLSRLVTLRLFADETDPADSEISVETDLGYVLTCSARLPGPEIMETPPPVTCNGPMLQPIDGLGVVTVRYRLGSAERDPSEPVPEKPTVPVSADGGCDDPNDPSAICTPQGDPHPSFTWLQLELFQPDGPFDWSTLTLTVEGNGHDYSKVIEPTFDYSDGMMDIFQLYVE